MIKPRICIEIRASQLSIEICYILIAILTVNEVVMSFILPLWLTNHSGAFIQTSSELISTVSGAS